MGTAIICLILLMICIFAIKSYIKKLRNGCCGGESDSEKKLQPLDADTSHYKYKYIVGIDGMSCQNCVIRVENAFNTQEGCLAKVNLRKRNAEVLTKETMQKADFRRIIARAGYEMTNVSEAETL
ncbi:MAG: cation transporter [Lachnospiraceae bacterium]|nr:cation transporter [Lachnospiraceae bacterium]